VLADADSVQMRFMDLAKVSGVPLYRLENSAHFSLFQSPPVADVKTGKAEDKSF
jgi:hypothetical protein